MMRASALFVLGLFQAACADEADFQDTPLLSSIWQAVSSKDNDAIDRLFDSANFGVNARASDGRGPAFWAWEFQNTYALGAIIAAGGDVESTEEDLQGSKAVDMCTENSECNKDKLLEEAKGLVEDIKKRKADRAKADEDDSDFDVDDSSSSSGDDDEF